jgi:hypothetical protein
MEIWKDIPGFEGRYQVSDLGRVRSLPYMQWSTTKRGLPFQRFKEGRVLKAGPHPGGYLLVQLIDAEGARHSCLIHRLVAEAFVDNHTGACVVNHKDGVKTNNTPQNLEWVTSAENNRHARQTGLHRQHRFAVIGTPTGGGSDVQYESQIAAEIALAGRGSSAIHHCLIGKKQSAYGYKWRRAC